MRMARKRHKAEEIVAKLRQVEVLTAQGRPKAGLVHHPIALGMIGIGRALTRSLEVSF
jgi:hypothetical protein